MLLTNKAKIDDYRHVNQALAVMRKPSGTNCLLTVIERIDIKQGEITLTINRDQLGSHLHINSDLLNEDALIFCSPFQLKKRGVEAKLVIGHAARTIDPVLIRNLMRAHGIFKAIKAGRSVDEIAKDQSTGNQRITELLKLALLSPQITTAILHGEYPTSLTSDRLLKTSLPVCWQEQKQLITMFG